MLCIHIPLNALLKAYYPFLKRHLNLQYRHGSIYIVISNYIDILAFDFKGKPPL
jgi:hypothetical protein